MTTILAIDPGFAALGWAVLELLPGGAVGIEDAGVLVTERETRRRQLHAGSDDARRLDLLSEALQGLVQNWRPLVAVYELPAAAKGGRANHALGLAHGVVRGTLRATDPTLALVEVTAYDAKVAATGGKSAGKAQVNAGVTARIAGAAGLIAARVPRVPLREHAFDACAIGLAALSTATVQALVRRGAA